eukprot:g3042.t1
MRAAGGGPSPGGSQGTGGPTVKIPVRFHAAYAQSAWLPFLNHVMHELKLEDIDGVYEDIDGAPVARVASLVDGGLYFARPNEVSAMLRSLVRTEKESYPAWPSVEEGLEAKRELERCRKYYEHQLLPMSLGTTDSKAAPAEAAPDADGDAGFVWAMKVKQGFKCRVYKTPECRAKEVLDILPMRTIVTLSTDWGEVLEKHPLRGKDGKGKVLWMISPQEGFVERRPLEEVKAEEGAPAAAAMVVAAPAAAAALTPEERMEVIRNATGVSEILRSTLRRGAYFEGAAGVHDDVRVHRAAMRAAATLMRKDPASREALLECKGIEMFVLLVTKFCEEDRLLCEYGCWAFAVFAGEGDSHPRDSLFQETLVEAGGLASIGSAVEAHRDSASLRRYSVGALAATVHDNASAAGHVHALGLHRTVAEDAIRRWPNDPELSCLACWALRSVVDPPVPHAAQGGAGQGVDLVLEGGGAGSVVGSVLSCADSAPVGRRGRARRSSPGGAMLSPETKDGELQTGNKAGGGGAAFDGSISSGSVFGTGDNETSDLLISLADDDDDAAAAAAAAADVAARDKDSGLSTPSAHGKDAARSSGPGPANGGRNTTSEPSTKADSGSAATNPIRGGVILPGTQAKSDENERLLDGGAPAGQPIVRGDNALIAGGNAKDTDKPGEVGVPGAAGAAIEEFEGEQDEEELERLLKLAEATKVLNHDSEGTRKSASALVEALLRRIDSSYASSSRRRRKASRGRVDRILREGRALGAL